MTDASNTRNLRVKTILHHWLLNLAVEYPVWLYSLFPILRCQLLNVKPVPSCNTGDYVRGLVELFESGMITISSAALQDDVESRTGIEMILSRFMKLATHEATMDQGSPPMQVSKRPPNMQVSFKLTALGGEVWETVAEPDWPHIMTISRDNRSGNLFSPNRDLLMAYVGWCSEIEQHRVQLETMRWQTHSDFEILYWKRLPLVHHISFGLEPAEARWSGIGPKWLRQPKWFSEWYISAITWYKKPWDLPAWPIARTG